METIGQIPAQWILFFTLYGITGVVPLIAALYLLLQRANAIAPGVTPPVRLRRWTAAFFGVTTLAHVWWLAFYTYCRDLNSFCYLVLAMLDCVLLFVTFAGMLLSMLQDRRRKVWPAMAAIIPFVLLVGAYMVYPNSQLEQIAAAYLLLLGLAFTVYIAMAIRQYERWLNDNYADLENKRVWLSMAVSLICMLLFVLYVVATDMVFIWILHIIELLLVPLILWRVETLPTLETLHHQTLLFPCRDGHGGVSIEQLLKEHCEASHLYLQHDLSLQQLAQAIGTNRTYLSKYFSSEGTNYNTYINNLRIQHFTNLCEQVAEKNNSYTVKHLALESGYRSYSTFAHTFKKFMGMTVYEWMQAKRK
jgi:AraC-like DNA-binding protein